MDFLSIRIGFYQYTHYSVILGIPIRFPPAGPTKIPLPTPAGGGDGKATTSTSTGLIVGIIAVRINYLFVMVRSVYWCP